MIEFQAMFPVMVTSDLSTLKDFYQNIFGFNAVFYQPDFYLHLVSPDTGVQLGFMVPEHQTQPDFLQAKMVTEGFVISLEVKDADLAYQQAMDMRLPIVMELKTEDWGQKHFIISDPAGFRLDLVEHFESTGN